jgi:hypothetical protein
MENWLPNSLGSPSCSTPLYRMGWELSLVRKNSYWNPRRVSGSQFESVIDGVVGASVEISALVSVSGESQ